MRMTLPVEDSILALVTSERFKRSAADFSAAQNLRRAQLFVAQGALRLLQGPWGFCLRDVAQPPGCLVSAQGICSYLFFNRLTEKGFTP